MLRLLHRHHLNKSIVIVGANSSALDLKSSSSLFMFKFKLLPTRSSKIHQHQLNLATLTSISRSIIPHRHVDFSTSTQGFSDVNSDFYSSNIDFDPILYSIRKSKTVQQIFDIFTSLQEDGTLNEKYSSQCLLALWHVQKYAFTQGHSHNFHPFTLFMDHRIKSLKKHPVFQDIVDHIMANYKILDDERLSTCLLVHRRFNYTINHRNCQKLIEELLCRKSTLGSAALSRLCDSIINGSLYRDSILTKLSPFLYKHAGDMANDSDIRNVSNALRSSYRAQNSRVIKKYQERLSDIWQSGSLLPNELEPITLLKIVMLLHVSLPITTTERSHKSYRGILSGASLIRNYGNLLTPRVSELTETEITTLKKFVHRRHDPVKLIEAISTRAFQLADRSRSPSLDLISCIQPKNCEQRIKLASYISDFMETCIYFDKVWHLILRVLLKIDYDEEIFDKFWGSVASSLLKQTRVGQINSTCTASTNDKNGSVEADIAYEDYIDDDDEDSGESRHRILLYAKKYLNFVRWHYTSSSNTYSHPPLERLMRQQVLELFKGGNNILLSPKEYVTCLSFLIYVDHPNIHQWSISYKLFKEFSCRDLRDIHTSLLMLGEKNDLYFISNALNKQAGNILRTRESLNASEYMDVAKLSVDFQRNFESCPNFQECMDKLATASWGGSLLMRDNDMMLLVIKTGYYNPQLLERASRFICEFSDDLPFVCVETFAWASMLCGADGLDGVPICAEIAKRNYQSAVPLVLLRSMLSFCYHGCLDSELVNYVFDLVDKKFLLAVDKQIKGFPAGSNMPLMIYKVFLQLIRAVRIQKPETNIPGVEQKYWKNIFPQEVVSGCKNNRRVTPVHREVGQVLKEIVHGPKFVAENVFSPYDYSIDFHLQFDKNGNPMKPDRNGALGENAATKVAILVYNPHDFTRNIRRLTGFQRMKTRHLEILGYQVIDVDPLQWNSVRMRRTRAKYEYLRSRIFKL